MKTASRFSVKAANASAVSAVEKLSAWQRASSSTACSIDAVEDACSSVFVMESANGGPAASVVAQSSTKASSSPTGRARFTSPIDAASVPLHMPPKSAISLARASPTSRGSNQEAPLSSERPRLAKIMDSRAGLTADAQVAAQRQREAGPDRHAVDFGDGGLGHAMQRQRDVAEPAHAHEACPLGVRGRTIGVAEVGARAEGAARTGEHHHAVVGRVLHRDERLEQLGQHLGVGSVLALGTVHRDGDDAVLALDNEGLHGLRPYAACPQNALSTM